MTLEQGHPPPGFGRRHSAWQSPLLTCTTPSGSANSHLPCLLGSAQGGGWPCSEGDLLSENTSPTGCREASSRRGYRLRGGVQLAPPWPSRCHPSGGPSSLCLSPGDPSDLILLSWLLQWGQPAAPNMSLRCAPPAGAGVAGSGRAGWGGSAKGPHSPIECLTVLPRLGTQDSCFPAQLPALLSLSPV